MQQRARSILIGRGMVWSHSKRERSVLPPGTSICQ
jgi:hypothetical protein